MTSVVKNIKSILPGFIVALIVALSSMFLAKFVPALGAAPIAIFLGMFVGNIFLNQKVFQRGYKFSESDLLSYSIVLLGATLSISTISEIGLNGVMFIVLQMTATIIGALYIGKKLGFAQNFRFLMASGNAVCGSSAIAATAPVIDADDNDKGIAITIVNVTGIVLMFLLPLLGDILYKNDTLHTSAIIGGILAIMWPRIKGTIENAWGNSGQSSCEASGGTWECDTNKCICKNIGGTNTAGK